MRALGVSHRVRVQWEARTGNTGDGSTYAPAAPLLGNVKTPRRVRRDRQGQTVTDPLVIELDHDAGVQVGDRVTVDGQVALVESVELVRAAFGVPHHVKVGAL